MKKENKKDNSMSAFYLFLILFFGWIFTQFIAVNEDKLIINSNPITSLAPLNVGTAISDALRIFSDILTPLFRATSEDKNGIFLRVIYWLFLFFIISGVEGLRKRFGADEMGGKRVNIIAGLIALMAVIFTPLEFLLLLGGSIFLFVYIGLVLGGLYFIYSFSRNEENKFIYFMKAFFSLVLIFLLSASSNYGLSKFSSSTGAESIFNLVAGLGTLVAILFFFWYLFVKTLTGGPTEEIETVPSGRQLGEAGGFYSDIASRVGGGIRNLFRRGERTPEEEQSSMRGKIQKKLFKELSKEINNARNDVKNLRKDPQNAKKYFALKTSMGIFLSNRGFNIDLSYLNKAVRLLDLMYQRKSSYDLQIFNTRINRLLNEIDNNLKQILSKL